MADRPIVTVFAPATVANVACGFDCLGFALEAPGDLVGASRRDMPGVEIAEVTGDSGRLPRDPARNTVGVAARALLDALGARDGVVLSLHKGLPLASGLGSSAASSVAAVVAVNALLGADASDELLLTCAMEGERVAAGSAHPDNAAPSLYGGFILVRGSGPFDIIRLPVPTGLACAVVHPHVEVKTEQARALLGTTVGLSAAVTQWANLGALVAALFRSDLEVLSRAMVDVVAEPRRAALVPGFTMVKAAALDAGALACSLSGSGPSVFAICPTAAVAAEAGRRMADVLKEQTGIGSEVHLSPVGAPGARVVAGGGDEAA